MSKWQSTAREAATSGFRCRAFRNGVLRDIPIKPAFINVSSPGILLAASALTILRPVAQNRNLVFILQVEAAAPAEQQPGRSRVDQVGSQKPFASGRRLPSTMPPSSSSTINQSFDFELRSSVPLIIARCSGVCKRVAGRSRLGKNSESCALGRPQSRFGWNRRL